MSLHCPQFMPIAEARALTGRHLVADCNGEWKPWPNMVNPWRQACWTCGGTRYEPGSPYEPVA